MDLEKSVWWRLKGGRAGEAKGPLPSGKRVGSREKKKVKVKVKESVKKYNPPTAVGWA